MTITVDLQIASEDEQPPPAKIEQWVAAALSQGGQHSTDDTELTVRIVDEEEIRELNHSYRGKDKTTNVLSFPADIPPHVELPLLGDIIICAAVVNREAREQHKLPEHHWAHMIVHGCLHLLGYDHVDDHEAEQMETLEIAILAQLNIANPYLEPENLTQQTVSL